MASMILRSLLLASLLGLGAPAPGSADVRNLDAAIVTPAYPLPAGADTDLLPIGRFDYKLTWLGLTVGHARVNIAADARGVGRALRVRVLGATRPVVELFFRYRLIGRGRVLLPPGAAALPAGFETDECERGHYRHTRVEWLEGEGRMRSLRQWNGSVDEYTFRRTNTLDMPSTVVALLTLDYAPGREYRFDTFTGTARFLLRARVRGRERLRWRGERVEAWHLRLLTRELAEGDPEALVFEDREGNHRETDVWISAEAPRRLLRARSRTYVGSIGLELVREPLGLGPRIAREARCGARLAGLAPAARGEGHSTQ
jgi:hypothetical protein